MNINTPPIGALVAYMGDLNDEKNLNEIIAKGWLPCDGRKLLIDQYPELFSVIGKHCPEDNNVFNLPNLYDEKRSTIQLVKSRVSSEYAVYIEKAIQEKSIRMQPGANIRVFNETESNSGSSIYRDDSGIITVEAGKYYISAVSIVTYCFDESIVTVPVMKDSNGGYCVLQELEPDGSDKSIAAGAVSHASCTPSILDTYIEFSKKSRIKLIHQAGREKLMNIFLQVSDGEENGRIFSRIVITRVS